MPRLMEFRFADTFTDSLANLTGQEQKAVTTTYFDIQLVPAAPALLANIRTPTPPPGFSTSPPRAGSR